MDPTDALLLNRLQGGLPLEPHPFRAMGAELGLAEEEALARVARLRQQGTIRRLGASFEPRLLGYVSTLIAARVPAARVEAAAAVVSAYPEVTHNYERDHEVNVWFTLIAPGRETLHRILSAIRDQTGLGELYDLPALRRFKVDARFAVGTPSAAAEGRAGRGGRGGGEPSLPLAESRGEGAGDSARAPATFSEQARAVVNALQEDLPIVARPFAAVAERAGLKEAEFLAAAAELAASGALRKLGALLRPHSAGLRGNAMAVWRVGEDRTGAVGARFAACPEVSHCYERPPFRGFPYTLYTMVHAPSDEECGALVDRMAAEAGVVEFAALRTVRELKRSTPRYHL